MGNWRNRPPRRFFNRQRPPRSPPTYSYDIEPSSSGFCEDGIPLWEKKFCTLIGSVPWQKVVQAKKFMLCNNVLNWDDSAGKEAFQNAKKRFWAEMNGFPCHMSLPDPDIYIDEINWNPDIDPELIKDLESVYSAPDEGEKDGKFGRRHKKSRNTISVPSERCIGNSEINENNLVCNSHIEGSGTTNQQAQGWDQWDNSNNDWKNMDTNDNPWERSFTQGCEAVKDNVEGWNQWDNNNNDSRKLNNSDSPWEHHSGHETAKSNAWGNCGDKFWGWNQGPNNVNQFGNWDNGGNSWECNWDNSGNSWECSRQGVYPVKDNRGWDDHNNSWCWSQQKSWKLDGGASSWEHNFVQYNGHPSNREWRYNGGNAWGWKQVDNYSSQLKHSELGRNGGNWRAWNDGSRKKEGSHRSSYKNSGHQQDYNQTGHCWRSRNANKRVQFCS